MIQTSRDRRLPAAASVSKTAFSNLPPAHRVFGLGQLPAAGQWSIDPGGEQRSQETEAWTWPEGGYRMVIRCRTTCRQA